MNRLGVYFGAEKLEAIFRGDTSNAVVHRHFVHSFQAIGAFICETPDESPAMVQMLARSAQKAWETLIEIYRTDDQKLKAQGVILFLHSLIVAGFLAGAQLYLLKLCELIDTGELQFLPVYGHPPGLSDQVREDAAVLSQTIYLENYFYLALNGPAPIKTARLEREFRQDFQVRIVRCRARSQLNRPTQKAYPILFDLCPLTMRTQSVLLIRDATLALDSHPADRKTYLNAPHRVVTDFTAFSRWDRELSTAVTLSVGPRHGKVLHCPDEEPATVYRTGGQPQH